MLIKALDKLCFFLFLILLIVITLPFGSFDGFYWSSFGFISSILLACVILINGIKSNGFPSALKLARIVVGLFVLQLIYVFLQSKLPLDARSIMPLIESGKPEWFVASKHASIVPSNMAAWLGKSILGLVFLLLGLFLIKTRRQLQLVSICIVLTALLHGVIGLSAKYFDVHLVPLESTDGHFNISRGLFVNRNHFAAMLNYGLSMLMVAGFYYLYKARIGGTSLRAKTVSVLDFILSTKLLWLFAFSVLLVSMNLSSSRAAIIGLFGAIVLVGFVAAMYDPKLRKSLVWLVAILVLIVVLAMSTSGESGIVTRLKEGGFALGERHQQWALTLSVFKKFWLFGSGVGTYSEAFQYFRTDDGQLRQVIYDQSHSLFFQNLLEQGVIGFGLWVATLFCVFRSFILGFLKQESAYIKSVILGVLIALITALLQSGVDFNLLIPALNVYFYTIIAIGYAALSIYSAPQKIQIDKDYKKELAKS